MPLVPKPATVKIGVTTPGTMIRIAPAATAVAVFGFSTAQSLIFVMLVHCCEVDGEGDKPYLPRRIWNIMSRNFLQERREFLSIEDFFAGD